MCGQAISNSGKNRRMKTILLLIGFVLTSIHIAGAQQSAKVYRVGVLSIRKA